jgi:tellurite resistance protein TerC
LPEVSCALAWVGFNLGVLTVLAIDLGLTGRRGRPLTPREATRWAVLWVALSLCLCAALWRTRGSDAGLQFLGSYLIEYALSVDNLFVFLVLFEAFRVRPVDRRRLLLWGVLGAVVMRTSLLLTGAGLVRRFEWLLVPFGVLLLFSAARLVWKPGGAERAPQENVLVRLARRFLPMADVTPDGFALVLKERGRWRITPLFLVLVMVETTDLLFAFDSIPAVLGMSQDAFIVYTSNVCAILGLRSLFFVLEALIGRLAYFKPALAAVLAFVGAKMVAEPWLHVPLWVSLLVIAVLLGGAILASVVRPPQAQS